MEAARGECRKKICVYELFGIATKCVRSLNPPLVALRPVSRPWSSPCFFHAGRVFVTSGFLQKRGEDGADARLRHLRVLAAATKLPGGVPDVVYRYETFASPDACEAPSLVQYKRQGYDACGVLAPAASLSSVDTVPTTRVEERVRKESQRLGSFRRSTSTCTASRRRCWSGSSE